MSSSSSVDLLRTDRVGVIAALPSETPEFTARSVREPEQPSLLDTRTEAVPAMRLRATDLACSGLGQTDDIRPFAEPSSTECTVERGKKGTTWLVREESRQQSVNGRRPWRNVDGTS